MQSLTQFYRPGSRRRWLPPLSIALLTALLAGCGPSREERPNIVLITLDTLRPDRIGCYGYLPARTPNLDRLAAEGVLFSDYTVSAPLTLPSHSTILSGCFPSKHGVHDNAAYALDDRFVTLPEAMKQLGYTTAAFVSSFQLDGKYGVAQGFDEFDDDMPADSPIFDKRIAAGPRAGELRRHARQRRAGDVTRLARHWIEGSGAAPLFLWVHYFDPHDPYDPPPPFDRLIGEGAEPHRLYDGEIAYMDHAIGALLETFEESGLYESTLFVVCADHGEGLGDHGEAHHDLFMYESTLRSPLVVGGGAARAHWPRLVTEPVTSVDILPTLLDFVSAPIPGEVDGRSVIPLLRGNSDEFAPSSIYMESHSAAEHYQCAPLTGVRHGEWKLIDAPRAELYHLGDDPGERNNLADRHLEKVSELKLLLDGFLGESDASELVVDEETRRNLEAIGYLDGSRGEGTTRSGNRPDPKDRVLYVDSLHAANRYIMYGELESALDYYVGMIDHYPGRLKYYDTIGRLMVRLERFAEMADLFSSLTMNHRGYGNGHYFTGVGYLGTGRHEEAAHNLERAIREGNPPPTAHLYLGNAKMQLGRHSEAMEAWRRTVELFGDSPVGEAARQAMAAATPGGGSAPFPGGSP